MFDRSDSETKYQFMQERTAAQFGEAQDESFVYEVEAEKQYVERLKNQREKVTVLPSRLKPSIPSTMSSSRTSRPKSFKSARRTVNPP
jgi:hypothetical protein